MYFTIALPIKYYNGNNTNSNNNKNNNNNNNIINYYYYYYFTLVYLWQIWTYSQFVFSLQLNIKSRNREIQLA